MSDEKKTGTRKTVTRKKPAPDASEDVIPKEVAEPTIDPATMLIESIKEVIQLSTPAMEFTASSGKQYRLTGIKGWTAHQNIAAFHIWKDIEKQLQQKRAAGEGAPANLITYLEMLMTGENGLWGKFFSILYIPVDSEGYKEDKAKEYYDDMLDLTNDIALGALAFFVTSPLSSIPRGILTYFRTASPMVGTVLDELAQHARLGNESSTSPSA